MEMNEDMVETDKAGKSSRTFLEKERICGFFFEDALKKYGQFWHICTPGHLSEIFNISDEDFCFSVNNMAFSAIESGIKVLSYSQMDNHIHCIAGCPEEKCQEFLRLYVWRLRKYLSKHGRDVDLSGLCCDAPIQITTLDAMRNTIVHIHRNGYVVNKLFNPFSYPWSSGCSYFNNGLFSADGILFNYLPYRTKRELSFRSSARLSEKCRVKDGMILPDSWVEVKLGESFFRDSHHYFYMMTKNVESYCEEARRLINNVILTDEELFGIAVMMAQKSDNVNRPALLSPERKMEVARAMHNEYNATNAQIQRILKIPRDVVSEMFPLTSKRNKIVP